MKKQKPVELTRELRRRQSDAEEKLWLNIRNREIVGFKFRRQQAIGKYIVDFISFDMKLIIEIDGGQHNDLDILEKDKRRTIWLEGQGYRLLRFWNHDVLENLDGVLFTIKEYISNSCTPSPGLSRRGRGTEQ
jgi:very-short-patch-repair endonuclease